MAETTIILGDWNNTTPAAPEGRVNVAFAVDRTGPIPKFSASIEQPNSIATFLIGIGAAIAAANDVAPIYRVKKAGTVFSIAAKAKAGLAQDASFMVRRVRAGTAVQIPTSALTIPAEVSPGDPTDWFVTTDFDNATLQIDDELRLDITAGNPQDVTLEVQWI